MSEIRETYVKSTQMCTKRYVDDKSKYFEVALNAEVLIIPRYVMITVYYATVFIQTDRRTDDCRCGISGTYLVCFYVECILEECFVTGFL